MAAVSTSFRHYVGTRRYDFGRGTRAAWDFIAFARGDVDFPDIASQRELYLYLGAKSANDDLVRGALKVWRSFSAYRSRMRQES